MGDKLNKVSISYQKTLESCDYSLGKKASVFLIFEALNFKKKLISSLFHAVRYWTGSLRDPGSPS